jgi:hypothetical protein
MSARTQRSGAPYAKTLTVLLLAVTPARAQTTAPAVVALDVKDCVSGTAEPPRLLHALEVELAPLHLAPAWVSSEPPETAAVVVLRSDGCGSSEARLTLRVWSGHHTLIAKRQIAIGEVPRAALPRTLALIVSEALGAAAKDAEERSAAPPGGSDDPVGAVASLLPLAETSLPAPRLSEYDDLFVHQDPYPRYTPLRAGAAVVVRSASHHQDLLLGFEFNARGGLSRRLEWAAELGYVGGRKDDLGETPGGINWWNASVGADVVAGGNNLRWTLGPRISLAHLETHFSDGSFFGDEYERELLTELGLRGQLSLLLGTRVGLDLFLVGGHTLGTLALTRSISSQDELRGWQLSWGFGVSVLP